MKDNLHMPSAQIVVTNGVLWTQGLCHLVIKAGQAAAVLAGGSTN
jgi:hypothetical protein